MPRGLFVTGTDTGVGKTTTCATLIQLFQNQVALRYWKPIQTGIESDDDTAMVARMSGALVHDRGVRLPRPLSPHLSARLAGVEINLEEVVAMFQPVPGEARGDSVVGEAWIVEGAGGALVPINEHALMVDLIAKLALPALVVARTTLGTINHTLLTLEALRARGIEVAGLVMAGEPNIENERAIEHYGRVAISSIRPDRGGYAACPRNSQWLEYLR